MPDRALPPSPNVLTAEQKLAASTLDIRELTPFMYAALTVIPKAPSDDAGGIAVTPERLLYNEAFIESLDRAEVTFYLIHALCHILMRHHVRRLGRDLSLWNRACDLYINKVISELFDVLPGGRRTVEAGLSDGFSKGIVVALPSGCLFDETIDVRSDTPETIYRRLAAFYEEAAAPPTADHGRPSKDGGQGISYSDDQSPGTGTSDEATPGLSPDKEDEEASPEVSPSSERLPPDPDEKDGSESDRSGPGGSEEEPLPDDVPSAGSDSGLDLRLYSEGSDKAEEAAFDRDDLIDDPDEADGADISLSQRLDSLIARIETRGREVVHLYGSGALGIPVGTDLPFYELPRADWRSLLRNLLTAIVTDDRSLATPDRRFVHRGLYMEGPVIREEALTSVKVCVDTSASMTGEDIGTVLKMIEGLIREFRVSADLVFWDSEIEEIRPFDSLFSLKRAASFARGRGGTDPSCLFRAFEPRNERGRCDGEAPLMLIFTDGWFRSPPPSFARRFRRNTLWFLCSKDAVDPSEFDPGFGKVISLL